MAPSTGGCAHAPANTDRASVAPLSAYREVRTGRTERAQAAAYLFCSAGDGVEVYRTAHGDGSGGWADKFDDTWLRSPVARVVQRDRALRDARIAVAVHQGEATLTGRVPSDAAALRAAQDALAVDGVVAVHLELDSPESALVVQPRLACY